MNAALITAALTPIRLRNIEESHQNIKKWLEREQQKRPAHEVRMCEYEAQFQEHKARFQIHEAQFQQRGAQFQQHKALFQQHEARIQQWREYDAKLRKWRERNTLVLEGKDPVVQWFREKASTIASTVTKMQIGSQTRSAYVTGASGDQIQSTFIGRTPQSSSVAAIPKSSAWGWPLVSGNLPPPGKRCSTREISGREGK